MSEESGDAAGSDRTAMKRRAGERAAADIPDDAVVGLGTGSTAAHAIDALGDRVADGASVVGVPTSHQSRRRAIDAGVPVRDLDQVDGVDVAIDGADAAAVTDTETDADGQAATDSVLVKGGGAAHAREKVVDAAADRLFVVVDPSKLADTVSHPVPVEVLPVAAGTVSAAVADRGGRATVRTADRKDGPVVTDNGNWVLDCDFGSVTDAAGLATWLAGRPGVVEHGLFVDLADRIYVGRTAGVDVLSVE